MGLKLDQHINYFAIVICFFIVSCTIYSKEEKNIMEDNCLSVQNEEVFWSTHVDKKNEFPLSLYIPVSMQKEVKMFDSKIKEVGCLSNSMLFIHLNIDNGVRKLHYYTWDNNMKGYHIKLSDKSNFINPVLDTEIIKNNMRFFEEMIDLSESEDMFIYIENKFLLDGSQVYLIIKNNEKIKRYGTYGMKLNRNIFVKDFAEYIQSILGKNNKL